MQYLEEGTDSSQDDSLKELFEYGKCDESARPGTGSKLYYINSWAMCWSVGCLDMAISSLGVLRRSKTKFTRGLLEVYMLGYGV